uniref:Uncharacterized protein n=1 Tax=Candidatus Kentrum sp. LFY TaxID=2126342 RepID=A0A450WKB7_9GAMM|nr:MAG: hypothetical protein BECKLFY1418C_GA0070996_103210 [Candidatus Kentron sp. LFY]
MIAREQFETAKPGHFVFESTVDADHLLQLPTELPEGSTVRITIEPIPQQRGESDTTANITDSEIGRLLYAARQAYIESGGNLMSQDEILAEIRAQRGEAVDD